MDIETVTQDMRYTIPRYYCILEESLLTTYCYYADILLFQLSLIIYVEIFLILELTISEKRRNAV